MARCIDAARGPPDVAQTGSGKTHSMMGTDDEPGVIPLAIQEVFDYSARPS